MKKVGCRKWLEQKARHVFTSLYLYSIPGACGTSGPIVHIDARRFSKATAYL